MKWSGVAGGEWQFEALWDVQLWPETWLHPHLWHLHMTCTKTVHVPYVYERVEPPTSAYRKKHEHLYMSHVRATHTHIQTHSRTGVFINKGFFYSLCFFICIKSAFICASLEGDVFRYLRLSWWRNEEPGLYYSQYFWRFRIKNVLVKTSLFVRVV